MKILVFSDSHGDTEGMYRAVSAEGPHLILHLGDHLQDGQDLNACFPDIPARLIRGNMDRDPGGADEMLFTLEGKTLFMTHGHKYGVKTGLSDIIRKGLSVNAHVVLFGHTHQPFLSCIEGVWMLNPGKAGHGYEGGGLSTYGVLSLEGGLLRCQIAECPVKQ